MNDSTVAAALGERFLTLFPSAPQTADVRAAVAKAAAAAGDLDTALARYRASVDAGRTERTDALGVELADRAIRKLESLPPEAEDRGDKVAALAVTAGELVAPIAGDAAVADDLRAEALNLLGWSAFYGGRFDDAATAYRTVVEELSETPSYEEALTQLGVTLARTDDAGAAEIALRTAWRQLQPDEPAPAGAAVQGRLQDAWIAGLERARFLQSRGDRAADAGEAYRELYEKFPNSRTGALLWEWGRTLYHAGQTDSSLYAEADAVFAELVQRAPDYPEADLALFLLAEGDLLADPSRPSEAARRFR
ncbi:MAG: tetratricopeptide repeat protein, partial [Planctomycetota bacterium]